MGIDHSFKGKPDYTLVNDHLSELMLLLKPKIELVIKLLEIPSSIEPPSSWRNPSKPVHAVIICKSSSSYFDDSVNIVFSAYLEAGKVNFKAEISMTIFTVDVRKEAEKWPTFVILEEKGMNEDDPELIPHLIELSNRAYKRCLKNLDEVAKQLEWIYLTIQRKNIPDYSQVAEHLYKLMVLLSEKIKPLVADLTPTPHIRPEGEVWFSPFSPVQGAITCFPKDYGNDDTVDIVFILERSEPGKIDFLADISTSDIRIESNRWPTFPLLEEKGIDEQDPRLIPHLIKLCDQAYKLCLEDLDEVVKRVKWINENPDKNYLD